MKTKELLEKYYSMLEELRERERNLISLRRKKLDIHKRLEAIKEKNREQIIQRLDKEINEKKTDLKTLENQLKEKKAYKLKLEMTIREIERKLQGFS